MKIALVLVYIYYSEILKRISLHIAINLTKCKYYTAKWNLLVIGSYFKWKSFLVKRR